MSWDDLAKPITAIGIAVGSVITLLLTKGVDAVIKIKNSNREDRQQVDQQQISGYMLAIEQQNNRIATLEKTINTLASDHQKCLERSTALEAENSSLAKHVELLQTEVDGLREWRHSVEMRNAKPGERE